MLFVKAMSGYDAGDHHAGHDQSEEDGCSSEAFADGDERVEAVDDLVVFFVAGGDSFFVVEEELVGFVVAEAGR